MRAACSARIEQDCWPNIWKQQCIIKLTRKLQDCDTLTPIFGTERRRLRQLDHNSPTREFQQPNLAQLPHRHSPASAIQQADTQHRRVPNR